VSEVVIDDTFLSLQKRGQIVMCSSSIIKHTFPVIRICPIKNRCLKCKNLFGLM
jgi:hypothetical protein